MNVREAAVHFQVHPATIRAWIRRGCPCLEEGSVGRGHGSRLDLEDVQEWRMKKYVPTRAHQVEQDVLAIVATALYDTLKRDGLMGQTLPAERLVLMIYERLYRNIKQEPLQWNEVPDELKRISANYLSSVERGNFHRR